jgi:2-(1,2-epoxy-1,2-dihydrophenyl)acetyl-CoA isomerase
MIKQAFAKSATNSLDAQLDLERDLQRQAGATPDYAEGVNAFIAKRAPKFTGRPQ